MKTVVFAYNNIGIVGIQSLINNGYEILAVYTHKDNPKENIWFDSVAELCKKHKIPFSTPEDINTPQIIEQIKNLNPDIIFSFYYREIIPDAILSIPPKGCFNLHGSLLPQYRGCAPINWAIINGAHSTGVTLHQMTSQIDAGPILAQIEFEIKDTDTALDLHHRAAYYAERLLNKILPSIDKYIANSRVQDERQASYFRRRTPADGKLDFTKSAQEVYNLIRGVTRPYPGASTYIGGDKYIIWSSTVIKIDHNTKAGTIVSTNPLMIACGKDIILASDFEIENNSNSINDIEKIHDQINLDELISPKKRILILGANGFIGSHLSARILASNKFEVWGIDLCDSHISDLKSNPNFHFFINDIEKDEAFVEECIDKSDIIVPLVGIATPLQYTKNPLRVFELDFEANLKIIRHCYKHGKRIIFPSTSEVYAMCKDAIFSEEKSDFVLGPINKQRWIYSCCKQMLDRIIYAYGKKGLKYTIFRPFNWIGPNLDSLELARNGNARVLTQFIFNLIEGKEILLIDGGMQRRCFTSYKDGVECLYRIILNQDNKCDEIIINIGNPKNNLSVKELAEHLVSLFEKHPLRSHFPPFAGYKVVNNSVFYGEGYQDCPKRVPSIEHAQISCNWNPTTSIDEVLAETLDYFLHKYLSTNKNK